jgi:hypothetical protein
MTGTPEPPTLAHLTLLLAQVDARLADQRSEWDGLDRKGTTVLAATGVLLGLVVNNAAAFRAYPAPAPDVYLASAAVLVLGLAAGVVNLVPRRFRAAPEPPHLLDYAGQGSEHTVGTLLTTKAKAFKINADQVVWKVRAVRAQLALLVIAGGLLAWLLWIGR